MITTRIFFIFLLGILFFAGCKQEHIPTIDGCMDPLSTNYNPDANFDSGNKCVYSPDKFVGKYESNSACVAESPFDIELVRTTHNKLDIHNFNGCETDKIEGLVRNDTIWILSQPYCHTKANEYLSGYGTLAGKVITFTYEISTGENCTLVGGKLD